ncbi:hypothetical protein BD779DRAFT_1506379 [Infundibulicybe gibba]|nr:hypothetical protein BD779DRAFT_1506379 [Infundibulicybe gibba]
MLVDSTPPFPGDNFLLFNPFSETIAEDSTSSSPTSAQAHPSSAIHRPVQGLRSRGFVIRGNIRSKTEAPSDPRASGSGHHPLRHTGLPKNLDDAGITRPHLSRMVKVGSLVDVPSVHSRATEGLPLPRLEQNVLAHDVLPTDSLAGVSLKYGISLADLRRANHLWASDSIHLRKVLFIPIEKASRAQETDEETPSPLKTAPGTHTATSDESPDVTPPLSGTGTVRRIPASEMSFFPPPSTTPTEQPIQTDLKGTPSSISKSFSAHLRTTTSPSHSLASILTALPITSSTRDNLIARLSFESVSSSYSDHDTNDGSEGHELERVDRTRHPFPNSPDSSNSHSPSLTTPKPAPRVPDAAWPMPPSPKQPRGRGYSQSETHPDMQYPRVRTAQMEPSPVMQLPPLRISKGKGRGRQRGSLIDVDFELDTAR